MLFVHCYLILAVQNLRLLCVVFKLISCKICASNIIYANRSTSDAEQL